MILRWNVQIFPFFGALLIWCVWGRDQEIRDCLQANHTCHQDYKCSAHLINMPRLCGDSGSLRCAAEQTETCRTVLSTLLDYNYFQTCVCPHSMPNYEECEFFRDNIFHHPCGEIHQEGKDRFVVKTNPNGRDNQEDDFDLRGTDYEQPHGKRSGEVGPSCVELRKDCLARGDCNRHLTTFRQACKVRRGKCYAESSQKCIQAYEALRPFGLFRCSCIAHQGHIRRKCDGLMRRFISNACLLTLNKQAISGKDSMSQKPGTSTEEGSQLPGLTTGDDYEGEQEAFDREEERFTPAPPGRIFPLAHIPAIDISCYDAFTECNRDYKCRNRMAKFISSCQLDMRRKVCNRSLCLPAMDEFFHTVDVNHAHAAAFCVCERNNEKCESLKAVLQPRCATVEIPVPSCLTVHAKCRGDDICRRRWEYYDQYCLFDKKTGACTQSDHLCRDAIVGLMGTVLMSNCTCENVPRDMKSRCRSIHDKLEKNQCREIATSTKTSTVTYESTPQTKTMSDEKEMTQIEVSLPTLAKQKRTCDARIYGERTLLRIYVNNTECSELCKCLKNNTYYCRKMPCLPRKVCQHEGIKYKHGDVFTLTGRGNCQCTKGEIICTKSADNPDHDGLYLHVGYSVNDLKQLRNLSVRVTYDAVSEKLTRLLNGESADNWECGLKTYSHRDGNINFVVLTLNRPRPRNRDWGMNGGYSQYNRNPDDYSVQSVCTYPTQLLVYMINSRHPSVTKDPQLSMIKVASYGFITHQAAQRAGSTVAAKGSSSAKATISLSTVVIVTLLCTSWTRVFGWT